jgi:hypothetical protein
MAAQVMRLPGATDRDVREVLRPVEARTLRPALPFQAPMLHPRAVEALLLAFRPLEDR